MTAPLDRLVGRSGGVLVDRAAAGSGGQPQRDIVDATHDSRVVQPGWLFCCVPGEVVDGHDFAGSAVERGASALLVERPLEVDVPQIEVVDVRAAMGPVAAEVHGNPSEGLTVVGVTGTNGKSSIVQLLADVWAQVQIRSEIIGTLVGTRTTPEGTDLQRQLRAAMAVGTKAVAMEVSSHAMSLHRVAGTRFAAAVFTNLGRDHLDFHETMDAYFEAKASLFTTAYTDLAVINADDEYGRRLIDRLASTDVRVEPYGMVDAEDLRFDGAISRFRWRGHDIVLQLAGSHNVSNALAAARTAELLGMDPVDIADALCATAPVRGRFEAVEAGQPFHVAVDYAHTPDALDAALVAAREVAGSGRVILVFGCGGDRDTQKRAEMGRVAEQGGDVVLITSDNPRSEDPMTIIDNILDGVRDRSAVIVEPDRQQAISAAVELAGPDDMLLIAGKGHETYQIVGDQRLDFDDRRAVLIALGLVS